MARLHHESRVYEGRPSETVLETLLRHGIDAPYSCRKGTCLTCVMRATDGVVPNEAQQGLKDTLRLEGYFLPCVCRPEDDLVIESPELDCLFVPASVAAVEHTTPDLARLFLEPEAPFDYRAGQFVNLRRPDGLVRSYSLASVPGLDPALELHVKRTENGEMSNWINDALEPGTKIDLQGPNGSCFYVPGKPEQPLLLIGVGSGLAPLIGIARDALAQNHSGAIRLYHGSRHPRGLYLDGPLQSLARAHANFTYVPCLSGAPAAATARAGRADDVALAELAALEGWRVFIAGLPEMVHSAKKKVFLAGAALDAIHADPFEKKDLRKQPRAHLRPSPVARAS